MGEVYRARDTKLNREVALKVLLDAFIRDPDRLARFTREAQVLASLNHPHIGAIYGFEDTGETHALVLELIEGDTLADRIARGAIALDEALAIARQSATPSRRRTSTGLFIVIETVENQDHARRCREGARLRLAKLVQPQARRAALM